MEYVNLGDVATYINGYAFKPEHRGKKGLPIIRIQDLNGNSHDLAFFDGKYPEQVEINTGDILISWSGSLGVYKWNKGKALLNQHIFKVLFNKIKIDKEYFCYAVKNSLSVMSQQTHGATMKHITKKDFDKVLIPYPSLNTQRKIAQKLNIVTELIVFYETELSLMEQLIKARFVEMFGDPIINPYGFPVKKIDEVAVLNKGITYSPDDISKEGIIVLRSGNIKGNAFDLEDIVRISKKISNDKLVNENDILMCNRNGSVNLVGKVAKIPKLEEKMTFGTFMTIVRSEIFEYLFVFFQMNAFREQIKFQTAVAINQISLPLLASVKVPIPTNELIKEFADFVQQVDKSRFDIKKGIIELEREVVYD